MEKISQTPTTPSLEASIAIEAPCTSSLPSHGALNISLSISPNPLPIEHSYSAPPTPPGAPSSLLPKPLRYPETLGTLIEIHDSERKGLGVFAVRDLLPGTILISEAPIVTLQDNGARVDPLDITVNALSPEEKESFLSLHAFSRNKNESRSRSIVYSNGYSIMDDLATGVFETASRINHSCVPNSHYLWKDSIGRMVFWNRFKLLEGDEVTVDYGHKTKYLKRIYGFNCHCAACTKSGSDVVSSSGSERNKGGDLVSNDEVVRNDELPQKV
ncbi:set domain containing protein [Diplocarpon rosae]|nr:set domain containing protein [Diplocarpon rosae]